MSEQCLTYLYKTIRNDNQLHTMKFSQIRLSVVYDLKPCNDTDKKNKKKKQNNECII